MICYNQSNNTHPPFKEIVVITLEVNIDDLNFIKEALDYWLKNHKRVDDYDVKWEAMRCLRDHMLIEQYMVRSNQENE